MNKKPILRVIIGPTAAGKTEAAIQLAKKLSGGVVSADSRQVYAGMNIGTATPLRPKGFAGQEPHDILVPDIILGIPHYLLNIRRPDQPMVLAEWQAAAYQAIDHVIAQGHSPLLVGGTMLYVDSIVFNYQIPNVAPNQNLRVQLEMMPEAELWEQLMAKDPQARGFIESHHKQRIIRALEVIEATGKPFSQQRLRQEPRYKTEIIGLFPSWEKLQVRIEKRVHGMLAQGLVEETKQLQDKYGKDLPLLKTMNYLQAGEVLARRMTEEKAIEEMIRANMRYARRQMSWWKGRKDIRWQV